MTALALSPAIVASQLTVRETSLGVRPPGTLLHTMSVGTRGWRLAYVVRTPTGDYVSLDGVPGRTYTRVLGAEGTMYLPAHPFAFHPASGAVAYTVQAGSRQRAVIDGVEGPAFDAVGRPFWTIGGEHLAYTGRRDGRRFVVVDGVMSPPWDSIAVEPWLTTGLRHIAYDGIRDGRAVVVLDGREVAEAAAVSAVVYSDSARRLAYVEGRPGRETVVLDGVAQQAYREIGSFQFSRDGRRSIYHAEDSRGHHAVVDGVESAPYDSVIVPMLAFSDDGAHAGWIARRGGKSFWVIDGKSQKSYDHIPSYGRLPFTPDGRQLAYAVRDDNQGFVVIGNREGPRFFLASDPIFARDGRALYLAERDGKRWFVDGDSISGPYDAYGYLHVLTDGRVALTVHRDNLWDVLVDRRVTARCSRAPYFAGFPDARRLVYSCERDGKARVIDEGVAGSSYGEIGFFRYSPDGKHLAYAAKRGGKWLAVVDGLESPLYDQIREIGPTTRTSTSSFTMLASRGSEDFRVTLALPSR